MIIDCDTHLMPRDAFESIDGNFAGLKPRLKFNDEDLYADVELMRVLVAHGAKASARGQDGASPLLRAVHDLGKARFLLERGANVDDVVMVAAARVPGEQGRGAAARD